MSAHWLKSLGVEYLRPTRRGFSSLHLTPFPCFLSLYGTEANYNLILRFHFDSENFPVVILFRSVDQSLILPTLLFPDYCIRFFPFLNFSVTPEAASKMSSISLSNSHALARAYPHHLPHSQRYRRCPRPLFSSNSLSKLQRFGITDRYSARPPSPLVLASSGAGVVDSFPVCHFFLMFFWLHLLYSTSSRIRFCF